MEAAGFWQMLVQSHSPEEALIVIAPAAMHAGCPVPAEPIGRHTVFVAGAAYISDSFDDVSGQTDVRVHLFVWNTRVPIYRVRTHFSPHHEYRIDAWLDGAKVTTAEFFGRPVGICPAEIYGSQQADQFADEWGWRCGMIHVMDRAPRCAMRHRIEWRGATTFEKLQLAIENIVGARRTLWVHFPPDCPGVLFYQETNPLFYAAGDSRN